MIPDIEFIRPDTLEETLSLLEENDGTARLLAGGTDILPGFQQDASRFQDIRALVDIHHLEELRTIRPEKQGLIIGGAVTFSEIVNSPLVKAEYPLLAKAVSTIGSLQIRNRATIAGNFVNNAPCADSVPPLLVYEARVRIQSRNSIRELPLQELLLRPYQTQLAVDEIVTAIVLPPIPAGFRGTFYKLGRRRGVAISRITLAVLARIEDAVIKELRIASGAVTPIGIRFRRLEDAARGQAADSKTFKKLAQDLGNQILDVTGLRWSTAYKSPVVQQMFYQLLEALNAQEGK